MRRRALVCVVLSGGSSEGTDALRVAFDGEPGRPLVLVPSGVEPLPDLGGRDVVLVRVGPRAGVRLADEPGAFRDRVAHGGWQVTTFHEPELTIADATAWRAAELRILDGDDVVRCHHVTPEEGASLVVGRLGEVDVAVDDASISRRHFAVCFEGGGWIVRDLASSWGTRVGGRKITGSVPLSDGDRIEAGETVFAFMNPLSAVLAHHLGEPDQHAVGPEQPAPGASEPGPRCNDRLFLALLIAGLVAVFGLFAIYELGFVPDGGER